MRNIPHTETVYGSEHKMKKDKRVPKTAGKKPPYRQYCLWILLITLLLIPAAGSSRPPAPAAQQAESATLSEIPACQVLLEEGELRVTIDLLKAVFPFPPGEIRSLCPLPPLLGLRLTLDLRTP